MAASTTEFHFLTGYPDFVCRRLFRELLASDKKARVALLVQPKYAKEAQREVAGLEKRQAARVELLLGDVVDMHLGLAGDEYRRLVAEATVVHHLAAVGNPAAGRPALERVNVDGTRNILELGREAQRLARLNHVSTVYVSGDRHGVIEEDELEEGQRFHDAVEETRFKAEVLVRKAMRHLPVTVFRPSTVVGDSRTGETGRFEGPDYLAVRLVTSPLRVPLPLPGDGSYPLNVVPADFVAKAIVALTREPRAVGRTFHLVDPNPLAARKVYEYIARRANKRTPKVGLPARASVALLRLPILEKLARPQRTALEHLTGVAIYGDLVLRSVKLAGDSDVFGYDLRQGQPFVVSRAIGDQVRPRIDGRTVVWSDTRNSGLGRDGGDPDIFGARLESGPAAVPAAVGAPGVADARIEILWPHGGAPTADADRANLAAWLFLSDSLDLAPCQWNPRVQLYRAENAEPARLVALGRKTAGRYHAPDGTLIPNWEFNDVDVSAARDPKTRLYFFVALDGVPGRTNVWAHGSDSRTNFPRRDEPAGIALGPTGPQGVEAKIEIVWPHGDAPIDEARLVNVSALVFRAGTLLSVPPEFAPRVRLLRSLNNGYLEPIAVGEKGLIAGPGFTYPAWEFNDVDVSAATNPANRYYFTLAVDGVPAASNVWSHGADARTYAPTLDEPTAGCR